MEVKSYEAGYTQARAILWPSVVGEKTRLIPGHLYRGALHLGTFETAFSGLIKGKLESGGFTDVVVYSAKASLPAAFGTLVERVQSTQDAQCMRSSRLRRLAAGPSTVDTSALARASARPRTLGQERSTPEGAGRRDSRTLMTLTSRTIRMMTQAGHAITHRFRRTEMKALVAMRAN